MVAEVWSPPNRYKEVRPLTVGGMGQLSTAVDTVTGMKVVIKRPRLDSRVSFDRLRERFIREQDLLTSVSHPNIIKVVEAGQHDGQLFLAAEFVDGVDLRNVVNDYRRLPLSEIRRILLAICDAIAHLHQVGIVHRDLQPANVLIGNDGTVKITDFGLAVSLDGLGELTQTGEVLGTIDYTSPEQRHRLPTDERTDQYSIGAIAYEMLTGEKPAGLFVKPSCKNPRVPEALDVAVMQALNRDPADRFENVNELRERLDRAFGQPSRLGISRRMGWIACGSAFLSLLIVAVPMTRNWIASSWNRHDDTTGEFEGLSANVKSDGTVKTQDPVTKSESFDDVLSKVVSVENPLSRTIGTFAASDWASRVDEMPETIDSSETEVDAPNVVSLQQSWSEYLGIPVFVENSIGMQFALIPPGRFVMGSTRDQVLDAIGELPTNDAAYWGERYSHESPAHIVTLTRPFYLGRHEVRLSDFAEFVDATGYVAWSDSSQEGGSTRPKRTRTTKVNWKNNWYPQEPGFPVTQVANQDAQTFCKWLGRREGVTYRLPSEAEWEYACRGGTRTRFSFGDSDEFVTKYAMLGSDVQHAGPVGSKMQNQFGLFDMHGNVWELVEDRFDTSFYEQSSNSTNPLSTQGGEQVHRGGSVLHDPIHLRSAVRQRHEQPTALSLVGFRVVVEIPCDRPTQSPHTE